MSTQSLIAWTNLAKLASVTATSSEALFPPANTINDIGAPSTGWQSADTVLTASLEYTLAVAGSTVDVIGIFRTNLSDTAQVTATIRYSGVDIWTETKAGPAPGYGQVVFILPGGRYADRVTIAIDDPDNDDNHLNVPLVFIGPAWLPEYSFAPSLTDGWEPLQNTLKTRGGQVYPTLLSNPRTLGFEFAAITPDDTYTAAREIARLAGMGGNFLVIADANGDEIKRDAVFGTLASARAMGTVPGTTIRTWAGTVSERL
jgi:hypothetical protein